MHATWGPEPPDDAPLLSEHHTTTCSSFEFREAEPAISGDGLLGLTARDRARCWRFMKEEHGAAAVVGCAMIILSGAIGGMLWAEQWVNTERNISS